MLISLVCPFYNEEKTVALFFESIHAVINPLKNYPFEIICINDGSKDCTLEKLLDARSKDSRIKILDLSRNFGKESALTAGMDWAEGDAVIPIDTDLQDPPELIPSMIESWKTGYDVVLARRTDRSSDSFFKRASAHLFYGFHRVISDYEIPKNVGDFRLMDRKVIEVLKKLPERRRFMKGIFAWVGFKTITLDYTRNERTAGHSKFNAWKLWNFALEGITSFSTMPLRIWTYIGASVSLFSLLYATFIIFRILFLGRDVPGYASLLVSVLFLGGIQLIGIGVIGEYIGRIYDETKQRPIYIIRKVWAEPGCAETRD